MNKLNSRLIIFLFILLLQTCKYFVSCGFSIKIKKYFAIKFLKIIFQNELLSRINDVELFCYVRTDYFYEMIRLFYPLESYKL